jgi:ubiquinone biosynthesis protein COQ4
VPLGFFEKGFLAIGSAAGALLNPRRAGQSETTGKGFYPEKLTQFS